jgi:menaquinone-specific isochorismate synthase
MNATAADGTREPRARAHGWLDAGLAIAARADGITAVAVPAPIAPAAALVAAWPAEAIVAWTPGDPPPEAVGAARDPRALVGIGAARELRGRGEARWAEVVAAARAVAVTGAVIAGEPAAVAALGIARPRFLGGAAFAPGAADRAPWLGFGDAWFALPRWTYTHDGVRAQLVLAVDAREAAEAARWRAELAIHLGALLAPPAALGPRAQPGVVELHRAPAAEWRAQVEAIAAAIRRGECAKVVAARTCTVALAGPARAAALLAALDERHAECVRVLVRPPGAGALVAATPERLLSRAGATVRCDALAGTISAGDPASAAALLESQKDRWEHDLVVRAIHDALTEAGAAVDAPGSPTIRALRHVLHLHTPISATLREPRHVLELAGRLHPTPAVGGTPTTGAAAWIADREPAPRGWYAAPVGWFDLAGDGELAVAIRSGVLVGSRAHLWTGAGIVAGSDPDRELAETESKLRAMLGALGVGAEAPLA